jgi:hypothetical protein
MPDMEILLLKAASGCTTRNGRGKMPVFGQQDAILVGATCGNCAVGDAANGNDSVVPGRPQPSAKAVQHLVTQKPGDRGPPLLSDPRLVLAPDFKPLGLRMRRLVRASQQGRDGPGCRNSRYAMGSYSRPAFSASKSTRKRSRRTSSAAMLRPAASAAMPLPSWPRNSRDNVGLPKVSHQLAIGAANWSRK